MQFPSFNLHYFLARKLRVKVSRCGFEVEFVECLIVDKVCDCLGDEEVVFGSERDQLNGEFCVFELGEGVKVVENPEDDLIGLFSDDGDCVFEANHDILHFSLDLQDLGLLQSPRVVLVLQYSFIVVAVETVVLCHSHHLHLLWQGQVLELFALEQLGGFDEFGD